MNQLLKYKAFISYSHHDKAFAVWLQREIENYTIPKKLKAKYPHLPENLKRSIFRDDEELASSLVLSKSLEEALDASASLIVLCSPHSVTSKWVAKEIAYFREKYTMRPVYSVVVSGEAKEVMPEVLGSEPLAIEMRQGKKIGLMKIIAALLKIPFADLWEREKKEVKKRMVLGGGVGLFLVILLFYALFQYRAISSNRELEQIHAHMSNIEYALKHHKLSEEERYGLQGKLEELKAQEKLKEQTLKWFGLLQSSIAKRAKQAYDAKGVDEALAILESEKSQYEDEAYAKKNMLRARLYLEKQDYTRADIYFQKAVAVDANYDNMYDYALFLMKENETRKAQELLEALRKYDLTMEQKGNVLNRLGICYRKLKRPDKARESYMQALHIRKELAGSSPQKYRLDLAWTYNNLGVLYQETKELNASMAAHNKAFELRKTLARHYPERYTFDVTCSMHNLGELYAKMKKLEKARVYFEEALGIRRELYEQNPQKYAAPLSNTLHELASVYLQTKKMSKAQNYLQEALKLRQRVAKEHPKAYTKVLEETQNLLKTFKVQE